MPYHRDNFGQGEDHLWRTRQVLTLFAEAQQAGFDKYLFPEFRKELPDAYVEQAVATIEQEWAEERGRRGSEALKRDPAPHFTELGPLQQRAMVELLRITLQKDDGPRPKIMETLGDRF